MEHRKHKDENDKNQQERSKLNQDSEKHLYKVAVFLFESDVLKKFQCGSNYYVNLNHIVKQLHPSKITKFSINNSQNQVDNKEYWLRKVKYVENFRKIVKFLVVNLRNF